VSASIETDGGLRAAAAVVIPNVPVVSIGPLARQWVPINLLLAGGAGMWQLDDDMLDATLAVHCPLNYTPLVPHDRRMIIGGLGDRLAPPEQARMLWEHWDQPRLHYQPRLHWFPRQPHPPRGARHLLAGDARVHASGGLHARIGSPR
jgi:hypothetical protein